MSDRSAPATWASTLHDIGHQDSIAFLVMERLEAETLADRPQR